LLILAFW